MKIGRNDPYWCGSGRKYKKCHLDKERQEKPNMGNLITAQKTSMPKLCMHPEASKENCSGKIIKAHTVQRNGGLSQIAKDGHVYTVDTQIASVVRNGGKLSLKLTGLKEATTFTGFCNKHDTEIFKPIETNPFVASEEHAFILAYRVLSRELYAKMFHKNMCGKQRDLDTGVPILQQSFMQSLTDRLEIGADLALRDMSIYKNEFDTNMLTKAYDRTRFHIILTDVTLPLMCSGGFHPEFTFGGIPLYTRSDFDNPEINMDLCTFSIIGTDTGSAIVFAWDGDLPICKKLTDSISKIPDDKLLDTMLKFSMEFFENIAISPSWYEALNDEQQAHISIRINAMTHDPACFVKESPLLISETAYEIKSNI